jgi:hypothetical protein
MEIATTFVGTSINRRPHSHFEQRPKPPRLSPLVHFVINPSARGNEVVDNFDNSITTMGVFATTVVFLTLITGCDAFAPAAFRPHSGKTSASLTELFAQGSKITMPALSSTMKEGRVVSWLKNEGDAIEAGEAIMVVESDKADMDVEAFEDGFLAKIIVAEGDMAPVGEAVALVAESMEEIDAVIAMFSGAAAAPAASAVVEAPAAATTGRLSGSEGSLIAHWLKYDKCLIFGCSFLSCAILLFSSVFFSCPGCPIQPN